MFFVCLFVYAAILYNLNKPRRLFLTVSQIQVMFCPAQLRETTVIFGDGCILEVNRIQLEAQLQQITKAEKRTG